MRNEGIPDCPPQDSAQHIVASLIARLCTISNGKAERPNMIGDYTVGHVYSIRVFLAHLHISVMLLRFHEAA